MTPILVKALTSQELVSAIKLARARGLKRAYEVLNLEAFDRILGSL